MDIWTAIKTILKKSPGIQAKYLVQEVHEKTGLSDSTIKAHLTSFALRGKLYREKWHYWLNKPEVKLSTEQKPSKEEKKRQRLFTPKEEAALGYWLSFGNPSQQKLAKNLIALRKEETHV